jgi:hypothetical protein
MESYYLFLTDDNISINKYVIEKKELAGFRFLSTHFCQNSLSNKNSSGDHQWLLMEWSIVQ